MELCKQYRSTVEFNFIDSTALINLGDPCKRASTFADSRLWNLSVGLVLRSASHSPVGTALLGVSCISFWRPCHGSTRRSPVCNRGAPFSIPLPSIYDLWFTQWHWDLLCQSASVSCRNCHSATDTCSFIRPSPSLAELSDCQ